MQPISAPPNPSRPAVQPPVQDINQEKFRQCLRDTDQYLKEHRFEEAKSRLEDAKALDPTNPYIVAFSDRIRLFESNPNPQLAAQHAGSHSQAKPAVHIAATPSKTSEPTQISREIIEQRLRQQIETEYKNKFMQELRKAEASASKHLEEERQKLEQQRHLVKAQLEHQISEAQKRLEQEYQQRLDGEVEAAEARLRQQFQEEQSFVETELKTRLNAHHEEQLRLLEEKLKQDQVKLVEGDRQSFASREKEMKEQFEHKLLDSLRKTEKLFREQTIQEQKIEQEKLRQQLTGEFETALSKERETLHQQNKEQKSKLEQSFLEERKKLAAEYQRELSSQIELIRIKEKEEFEQKRSQLRQDIESEFRKKYEEQIDAERKRALEESNRTLEKEKKRLQVDYDALVAEQNEKVQTIRKDMRNEMEQAFINRLEQVAREFDHKMDLLGTKIPEGIEEKKILYRDRMKECYVEGQPTEENAKRIMELKELLELSFDDHLVVEADVRLNRYVEVVEKKVLAGTLNLHDATTLIELKNQFRISTEEASRLEPYILSSFQRIALKGRILLADDEPMLLESTGNILTDCGYQVITALDVNSALEKLQTTSVDLIVSDIKFMPDGLDGFQFFKSVQEQPHLSGIPFVFMSSLKDAVIVRSGVQLGVDDYLTKPVDPEMLIAVIEGKLKRHRTTRHR